MRLLWSASSSLSSLSSGQSPACEGYALRSRSIASTTSGYLEPFISAIVAGLHSHFSVSTAFATLPWRFCVGVTLGEARAAAASGLALCSGGASSTAASVSAAALDSAAVGVSVGSAALVASWLDAPGGGAGGRCCETSAHAATAGGGAVSNAAGCEWRESEGESRPPTRVCGGGNAVLAGGGWSRSGARAPRGPEPNSGPR
jgi:hypothetical protein